jgi:TalC/MipB family fructose-6-phosphate aldolase|nr:transaldolase family protein [uncultured Tolumonas sp.]
MIYMLDTANIKDIARCIDLYPISGVTTNPSIVAKENKPLAEILKGIKNVIGDDIMLHAQVMGKDATTMIAEAYRLQELVGSNFVVKIPATAQGIKAMKVISKSNDLRITATAILSPQQALMAAVAGAEFLAPYVNRLDNICADGVKVVSDIVTLLQKHNLKAKVLAASFKNVQQVHDVSMVGAQSVTISPDVFEQLILHPLTDSGVAGFVRDWEGVYGKDTTVLDVI